MGKITYEQGMWDNIQKRKPPTDVKPGQMYLDQDLRSEGVGEFVVLAVVDGDLVEKPYAIVQRTTKKTQIRCDRLLNPKFYRYIGRQR